MAELVQAITVTVGGNERRIPPFRSYKIAVALDIVGSVTDQMRGLVEHLAEEQRKYAEANPVRLTRQACIERAADAKSMAEGLRREAASEKDGERLLGLEDSAAGLESRAAMWERQLENMGERDYTEYPGTMPQEQEILVALPHALQMRTQFVQLLGLAICSDDELKDAWTQDSVIDLIEQHGKDTLFEMEAGEEVEFLLAARQMLEAQLRPRGTLEKLRGLRRWWTGEEAAKTTENGSSSQPEPEPDTSQDSSTSSPPDTAGDPSESSLASSTT